MSSENFTCLLCVTSWNCYCWLISLIITVSVYNDCIQVKGLLCLVNKSTLVTVNEWFSFWWNVINKTFPVSYFNSLLTFWVLNKDHDLPLTFTKCFMCWSMTIKSLYCFSCNKWMLYCKSGFCRENIKYIVSRHIHTVNTADKFWINNLQLGRYVRFLIMLIKMVIKVALCNLCELTF